MKFVLALAFLAICAAVDHDAERARKIEEINSTPGILWKAGVNPRFAGLPVGASKDLCGVKPGGKARLRALVDAGKIGFVSKRENLVIPTSFDSEEHWPKCAKVIGDIRDQSNCGCCWAFGGAEAASDRLCIATDGNVSVALSAQETCFCAQQDGCDGGQLETAWDYIQSQGLSTGGQNNHTGPFADLGLCTDFSLPHCHHHGPQGFDPYPAEGKPGCPAVTQSPQCPTHCDNSSKAPYNDFAKYRYSFTGQVQTFDSDADTIAAAIMAHGPVEAAFDVYSDFENYVSGIYHATSTEQLGGHAIKIVGWGEENGVKYWKVANSWNPYWGEKGYFRILRGTDECGIEDECVASEGDTKWVGPGVTPPGPPTPPTPGICDEQESEVKCDETSEDGTRCTWCFLRAIGVGICQKSSTCSQVTDFVN
eukprot:CAMPEP_0114557512 /NCGR_PEP_ID=MMETSP0114-20121206/9870_1 /TAXON_ID=31324 /ORGANISM="Goniomonas sp, Strain m" /LENGTH=422 /DNA_ID=CAMNT_0001742805 /DNA_START=8 /DNA_END=1276 /DNA_ORIENTATION=-